MSFPFFFDGMVPNLQMVAPGGQEEAPPHVLRRLYPRRNARPAAINGLKFWSFLGLVGAAFYVETGLPGL